jgi:hypothetical protein
MQSDFGSQSGGIDTPEGFLGKVGEAVSIPKIEEFASAITRLSESATIVNKVFTQGRQRMIELSQAAADALPNVMRLHGELSDVTSIMSDVAEASRRNVIATTEQVEQLFAASKVLGLSAKDLSNSFLNTGYAINDIGDNLSKSVRYVQSIGGNAKEVVGDMQANMEQLNRYQFEGGVLGLTKMAAQASMLRFDMSQTFTLAERVLDPDGAIEVASAFQRLGVSAGNLVDPFQLMNQSINDPSGLQNSLADVAKQFSYFDEQTKTFKINPQGVLTLREIGKQTGVSAQEMSKMALASAELDRRLSAVSGAGLKIASEEDKQYLANIATMTKEGTYEVTLKDGTKKELQKLNQDEFDELIRQQKEGPQTLEEIARSQMNMTETIEADLSAIRNKVVGGVATATPIQRGFEGARNFIDILGGEVSKIGGTKDVREKTEAFMKGIGGMTEDLMDPKKNKLEVLQKYMTSFGDGLESVQKELTTAFKSAIKIAEGKLDKTNPVERAGAKFLGSIPGIDKTTTGVAAQQAITKEKATQAQEVVSKTAQQYGLQSTTKVEFGVLKVDLNIQGNQTFTEAQKQEIVKTFTEEVRKVGFSNAQLKFIEQSKGPNLKKPS